MKQGPVITEFAATFKVFIRSKGSLFFTLAFPVLLIVIFGAIFSNAGAATHTLYVQNLDGGADSQRFIEAMNATRSLDVKMVDPSADPATFIKDNTASSFMVIPIGFGEALANGNGTIGLDLRTDQSASAAAVQGTLVNLASSFNLQIAHGHQYITVTTSSIIGKGFSYMDYFLPGVIGLTIMSNTVYFTAGTWIEGRTSGIFKKLVTTPMTRAQWLSAKLMFEIVIVLMSIAVIFVAGALMYGVQMTMSLPALAMVLLASGMFTGLGMVIVRFAPSQESSNAAISAITLPMMFLSGSFFPLDQMPSYLSAIAKIMPLTYVNNGLRDAMVYGNEANTITSLVVVGILFIAMFVAGVALTSWREDGENIPLRERIRRRKEEKEEGSA